MVGWQLTLIQLDGFFHDMVSWCSNIFYGRGWLIFGKLPRSLTQKDDDEWGGNLDIIFKCAKLKMSKQDGETDNEDLVQIINNLKSDMKDFKNK